MLSDVRLNATMCVQCRICKDLHHVQFNGHDYVDWQDGKYLQDAMPYLTEDERELMISQICGPCFDSMFSE